MKKIEDIQLPEELKYTAEHEWVRTEGEALVIGVTDYAQDQLGDVVFVELPTPGTHLAGGVVFATVESVKSVSECFLPLAGEVVAINEALTDHPELINTSPYGDGWMVQIRPDDPAAFAGLLTVAAYEISLKGGS